MNAVNAHTRHCPAKKGHIFQSKHDSSGDGVENMKECERGEDEENLSEEGVAHYKEVEKDGADDGGVNYAEDFFMEEVHMTETHCFKEVALPNMHQHPTEGASH